MPRPSLDIQDAVNSTCPWSGEPISPDALTTYRGQTVGFCNPGCRDKFEAAQAKTKADAAKLSPPELKLKAETEDLVASTDQALKNLKRAYALNPNTFDSSVIDAAQRKILEAAGSKDPKVLATRELENLLSKGAVEKLRASFGGNPTEGERKILLSLEGLESKSIEERKRIMLNAYDGGCLLRYPPVSTTLPHLRPCSPSFFLPSQMNSSLIHHTFPALSSKEVFFIEEIRRFPYSTRDGLYHLHHTCNYTVYKSG